MPALGSAGLCSPQGGTARCGHYGPCCTVGLRGGGAGQPSMRPYGAAGLPTGQYVGFQCHWVRRPRRTVTAGTLTVTLVCLRARTGQGWTCCRLAAALHGRARGRAPPPVHAVHLPNDPLSEAPAVGVVKPRAAEDAAGSSASIASRCTAR